MSIHLLAAQILVLSTVDRVTDAAAGCLRRARTGRDAGQSTAEYALVLLGAATVAVVFIAWAGKSNRLTTLFNSVLDAVIGKI